MTSSCYTFRTASNEIEFGEHIGTHLDAPFHISKTGAYVDELQFDNLHGPAVVIDITEKVKTNSDAVVTDKDLIAWEAKHGPIPEKAWILMYSGW